MSFLQHKEDTKPFLDLAARFPTVLMKYFKQIFFRTFAPENLTKLSQGMADRAAVEASQEVKGIGHMLLYLEIYSQIVLHFSAVSLLSPLQQSLSQYRVRLIEMSVVYKFDSIRAYNATFMRTRILLGQDDAAAWALENRQCCDLLVRKTSLNEVNKASLSLPSRSYSSDLDICRNFNEGRYTREHCKYSHICSNCQ